MDGFKTKNTMKRQELATWNAYYTRKIDEAKKCLELIQAQYIEANAPHKIGSTVTVIDIGEISVLRIKGYDIVNGKLIPKFETLEGKNKFVSRLITIK